MKNESFIQYHDLKEALKNEVSDETVANIIRCLFSEELDGEEFRKDLQAMEELDKLRCFNLERTLKQTLASDKILANMARFLFSKNFEDDFYKLNRNNNE